MKTLGVRELSQLEAGASVPFELQLGSQCWHCEQVLRVLPGRRVVLQARRQSADESPGSDYLLKLFIGSGGNRYRERERRGLQWLNDAGLPVPDLLEDLDDAGLAGLIIEYLPSAAVISPDDQDRVEQAAALLGRMHQAGLWQVDLHLKNFVVSGERLFAVDGDGVRRRANPVPAGKGLEDLALLAAQRPPQEDEGADGLLRTYSENRPGLNANLQDLQAKIGRARHGRVRRYLKKCFRSCTEFSVGEDADYRYFALRGRGELVRELLSERDAFSTGDEFLEMEAVKLGNSATLVRTRADGGVIIKRYNVKSLRKGMSRLLRPTPRYRRAWMCGQLMTFLGLPTAEPLLLIEQNRRFRPAVAFLVMEELGGRDLAEEVAEDGLSHSRAAEVARLFVLLKRAGLTHGDTKATNFVIHADRVHLIDLDAMALGVRHFEKDLQRFLDNWEGEVRERFQGAFSAVGLL